MLSTRAFVASVVASVVSLAFVGCGEPEPTPSGDSNVLANVETSVRPTYTPPLKGGVCPDKSSPETADWYQQRATLAFQYVVGGKDPFTKEELDANPECVAAQDCTTTLRNYVVNGKYAKLNPASTGSVCGLTAALYSIELDVQIAQSVWDSMARCGDHLDACWGVGVSGFYYADPEDRSRTVYIDPEPAKLTEDLSGDTGATAAAVYSNSGTRTTVLKWPSTYTNVAYPPLAGTPCSTGDLAWGSETYKIIQAAGSFRRCY